MGITAEYWGTVTGKAGSLGFRGPVINYGEWGGGQVLCLQKRRGGIRSCENMPPRPK